MNVMDAINKRKSVRSYTDDPVSMENIEKLIEVGLKVPSAGARRPLRIYPILDQRKKRELCRAALSQKCIEDAPVCLVIAADTSRTVKKYHRRGYRYVYMEAGHAGQNIALVAVSLGLGTVMVGAFKDGEVKTVLGIDDDPLYIIPVGKPSAQDNEDKS